MTGIGWTVETVSAVDAEIEALPVKLRARLVRTLEAVENVGLEAPRAPHVRHLYGKFWELRIRVEGGIARGCLRDGGRTAGGGAACLHEEVAQDAASGARDRQGTDEAGDVMTKLKDLKKRFMEDPEYR